MMPTGFEPHEFPHLIRQGVGANGFGNRLAEAISLPPSRAKVTHTIREERARPEWTDCACKTLAAQNFSCCQGSVHAATVLSARPARSGI